LAKSKRVGPTDQLVHGPKKVVAEPLGDLFAAEPELNCLIVTEV
jgi:hypothetical protein